MAHGFLRHQQLLELMCCWNGKFYAQQGYFVYLGGEAQHCSFSPLLSFGQLHLSVLQLITRCGPD